jgi:PQQ-dependent catabolism-associated CXXCW motif protein
MALADVPEPDGYRGEPYRAPVPATLSGASVVGSAEAHALWDGGDAVFIDVLPRAPKPANLPEGTIWHQPARQSIPGAAWLPNVGYNALAPAEDAYFRDSLDQVAGDDATPLVFFCLADCWMSWNAATRALEYGYTEVHWYPEGTDGWTFEDYPTEPVEPFPRR